jgi:hypothetical protein
MKKAKAVSSNTTPYALPVGSRVFAPLFEVGLGLAPDPDELAEGGLPNTPP